MTKDRTGAWEAAMAWGGDNEDKGRRVEEVGAPLGGALSLL
jgi:hypothetical protein